jgi:RNA polymerase sigma factor (sigma-70 family)
VGRPSGRYVCSSGAFYGRMSESLRRLPDALLLARCRREPAAFGIVYDRHADVLFRSVVSWCRDTDVALEVVQETFARGMRDAHRFRARGDGSALPWLRTIARNLVYDWRRDGVVADRVRRELGIHEARGDSTAEVGEWVDAAEARREMKAALALLPASQRDAVAARVVLSASYEEIASAAGVTREAARVRVSRGLRTLRALLAPTRGGN